MARQFAKKTFSMKSFSRFFCVILGLALGGVLIFGTAGMAAETETFTLDSALAAAGKGDPQAEFFLARHYADGPQVSRDYVKAVQYLRQAASQGYAPAQTGLGSCYAHGEGVPQDKIEAVQWYRRAAFQGEPLAEYCFGNAYAQGIGWPKDISKAVAWWQKAAGQGQADAENALGEFYLYGEFSGDTNHVNYAEAARWFRKAAGQNDAAAMGSLGYMYLYGLGVGHDFTRALQWNRRAAELDNGLGQDNLGQMYENGEAGLHQDLVQAYKWYWLSEQQGNPLGKHDALMIEWHHALTSQQIAEAKRMADEFHAELRARRPAATSEDPTDSAR